MTNPLTLTKKWAHGSWNKYEYPYQDYSFYSLYGWRVNPPNKYPQNTFNTPFDSKMRECGLKCNRSHDKGNCLEKCKMEAVKYTQKYVQYHGEVYDDKIRCLQNPIIEKYSNVSRSLPSHTSPRYRSYDCGEEMAPFCFYR